MAYLYHVATLCAIYSVIAVGLSLSVNSAGILNIGITVPVAIGAYLGAVTAQQLPQQSLLACAVAGGIGAVANICISLLSVRLRGDYFALTTIATVEVARQIIYGWRSVTGGAYGLSGIPPMSFVGIQFLPGGAAFLIATLILMAVLFAVSRITRTLAILPTIAAKYDPVSLAATGGSATSVKAAIGGVSGFIAGIGGAEYALYIGYIHPVDFTLGTAVTFLVMAIVAMERTPAAGAVIGASVYFGLFELLRLVRAAPERKTALSELAIGVVLYTVVTMRGRL